MGEGGADNRRKGVRLSSIENAWPGEIPTVLFLNLFRIKEMTYVQ